MSRKRLSMSNHQMYESTPSISSVRKSIRVSNQESIRNGFSPGKSTVILVVIVVLFCITHSNRLALKIYMISFPQLNTKENFTNCSLQGRQVLNKHFCTLILFGKPKYTSDQLRFNFEFQISCSICLLHSAILEPLVHCPQFVRKFYHILLCCERISSACFQHILETIFKIGATKLIFCMTEKSFGLN